MSVRMIGRKRDRTTTHVSHAQALKNLEVGRHKAAHEALRQSVLVVVLMRHIQGVLRLARILYGALLN